MAISNETSIQEKRVNTPQYDSKFLFYGLLLYLPVFYSQIGSRIPSLEPFRLEFCIGALLLVIIVSKIIQKEIDLNENKFTYASILFFVLLALMIPFAFIRHRAFETYIAFSKFFAIYFMIISCIGNEKRLRIFTYVYLACISLLFVEPFILSLQGKGFQYANHMTRLYGITGMFDHPNQLGGITAANLSFFYFLMLSHKSKILKLLFLSLIMISLRVIMLTQSRTAFVTVVAIGFFVWLFSSHKKKLIFIMLIAGIVIWNFAPEQTKDRFRTLSHSLEVLNAESDDVFQGNKELGSMNSRMILLRNSIIIFYENPIFGVGIHNFSSVSGRRWDSWMPAHCLYTEALSEIGLVGTLAFAYVLILAFKNLAQSKLILENNNDKSFLYQLNMAVYIYLLTRLVVGIFGQDMYRMWWWIAGGYSVVILRIVQNKYLLTEKNG